MSKNIKDKQKFIELRAEGLSYDKISKEISVSKPTLMKWEKEFSQEIGELKFIEFETLKEKYLMGQRVRLESYGELLKKVKKELMGRDFKELTSEKLISILAELENKFKMLLEGNLDITTPAFSSGNIIDEGKEGLINDSNVAEILDILAEVGAIPPPRERTDSWNLKED